MILSYIFQFIFCVSLRQSLVTCTTVLTATASGAHHITFVTRSPGRSSGPETSSPAPANYRILPKKLSAHKRPSKINYTRSIVKTNYDRNKLSSSCNWVFYCLPNLVCCELFCLRTFYGFDGLF